MEVNQEHSQDLQQPVTAIARVLCLCLMSFSSRIRDQEWRNNALEQLPVWTTSSDYIRSEIPRTGLQRDSSDSDYTPSVSTRTISEYLPSSPVESSTGGHRLPTRSGARCAPMNTTRGDTPDSDTDLARGQKRCISQVMSSSSSPSVQQSARQTGPGNVQSGQSQQHRAQFCTQQCLLGLQQGGWLDNHCPNIKRHRQGGNSSRHLINAGLLVRHIKQQLDENIDDCTPMGGCGASGAPFKITCSTYGYTVGSAVPVFLGAIDLVKVYFLNGAGAIRHMLLMAWGGESISKIQHDEAIRHEISRS
ncbi:hypothetical protein BBP40_003090 [Aspergillus hancockii]|nr:hypothetical protein BBP40_003090 [Aspergillus hancockii]